MSSPAPAPHDDLPHPRTPPHAHSYTHPTPFHTPINSLSYHNTLHTPLNTLIHTLKHPYTPHSPLHSYITPQHLSTYQLTSTAMEAAVESRAAAWEAASTEGRRAGRPASISPARARGRLATIKRQPISWAHDTSRPNTAWEGDRREATNSQGMLPKSFWP